MRTILNIQGPNRGRGTRCREFEGWEADGFVPGFADGKAGWRWLGEDDQSAVNCGYVGLNAANSGYLQLKIVFGGCEVSTCFGVIGDAAGPGILVGTDKAAYKYLAGRIVRSGPQGE